MPFRKYGRKIRRRKPMVRRKARYFNKTKPKKFQKSGIASRVIIKQPSGVPDHLFVKLVFSETLSYTSSSGAVTENIFRGNSLFDPDLTGTGTQPYFFDQWSTMYQNYRVHGSSLRADFSITPFASGAPAACNISGYIVPNNRATAFGASDQLIIMQQPYVKYRAMTPYTRPLMHKKYISTDKVYGLVKGTTSKEDNLQALTSANPTDQWYWHVGLWTTDQATSSNAVTVNVRIIYYCEFFRRTVPSAS